MRRQFECDEWEIKQLLRQRQLAHAGVPAAEIDLVNRRLKPLLDPNWETLDAVVLGGAVPGAPLPPLTPSGAQV